MQKIFEIKLIEIKPLQAPQLKSLGFAMHLI